MDRQEDTRTLAERLADEWAAPPPSKAARKPAKRTARLKAPAHPLADSRGRVYPHRATAWDVWGAGPHRCWSCGVDVYWLRQVKGAPIVPCELRVAFADGDCTNISAGNLRPSCARCAKP